MPKITLENGQVANISQESYDAIVLAATNVIDYRPLKHEELSGCSYIETRTPAFYFSNKEVSEKFTRSVNAYFELLVKADFKPDWNNLNQIKWTAYYNGIDEALRSTPCIWSRKTVPYFKSENSIKQSFEKDRQLWMEYLMIEG